MPYGIEVILAERTNVVAEFEQRLHAFAAAAPQRLITGQA
jgi:hypothetical protein